MHLIWLRTDLRLHDNTALAAACQRGPVAAVYLITPQQWLAHDDAPVSYTHLTLPTSDLV